MFGGLSDDEEHVGQEEVPVPIIIIYHPSQHPLEGLIKPLHQAISLRMVDGCL